MNLNKLLNVDLNLSTAFEHSTINTTSANLENIISRFNVSTESVLSQVSKSVMPVFPSIASGIKSAAEDVCIAPYIPKVEFSLCTSLVLKTDMPLISINSK